MSELLRYAVIDGGRVVNVIMCDPNDQDQIGRVMETSDAMVPSDTAGPGWGWTQEGGFTPPEPAANRPAADLSRLEFLRRFTPAERQAIRSARAQSVELDDFMYLLESTGIIHLDNADVIFGLALLEASGLLAAGRASEILSG